MPPRQRFRKGGVEGLPQRREPKGASGPEARKKALAVDAEAVSREFV